MYLCSEIPGLYIINHKLQCVITEKDITTWLKHSKKNLQYPCYMQSHLGKEKICELQHESLRHQFHVYMYSHLISEQ